MKLFSPDSLVMRSISITVDFILLNLLVILFSIPIVTCGAAVTALYTVMWRIVRSENYAVMDFFTEFKKNFKPATAAEGIFALGSAAVLASYKLASYFSQGTEIIIHYFVFVFAAALIMTISWAFPMISQFDNKTSHTLVNSFKLAVGRLPRTLIMSILNVLPYVLFLLYPKVFLALVVFMSLGYFSLTAYVNVLLMNKEVNKFRAQLLDEETSAVSRMDYNTNYVEDSEWAALKRFYNAEDDLKPEEDIDDDASYEECSDDISEEAETENNEKEENA